MSALIALVTGLIFSTGLALGGMTRPSRVLAFLDVGGAWDPSLLFVMGGAVIVFTVAHRWSTGRARPFLAPGFADVSRRDLDARLVGGAALFGVGWGLSGFCPGPAFTAVTSSPAAAVTIGGMALGWVIAGRFSRSAG